MNRIMREHADRIVREAIAAVQPDAAVRRAVEGMAPSPISPALRPAILCRMRTPSKAPRQHWTWWRT